MTSRVFLIEPPRAQIDMTPAAVHGEIVTVFGPQDRRRSIFNMERYSQDFLARMRELQFDPSRDYFVVSGAMLAVVLGFNALCIEYGSFRALVYNSSMNEYIIKQFRPDHVKGVVAATPPVP